MTVFGIQHRPLLSPIGSDYPQAPLAWHADSFRTHVMFIARNRWLLLVDLRYFDLSVDLAGKVSIWRNQSQNGPLTTHYHVWSMPREVSWPGLSIYLVVRLEAW